MRSMAPDVLVVGAGMAGIACALSLHEAGRSVGLLEASDAPGGRVRTDRAEGFLLDRGFQVLLTAYPEARRLLDYEALQLHRFTPGALVYFDGRLHRVQDREVIVLTVLAVDPYEVVARTDSLNDS